MLPCNVFNNSTALTRVKSVFLYSLIVSYSDQFDGASFGRELLVYTTSVVSQHSYGVYKTNV